MKSLKKLVNMNNRTVLITGACGHLGKLISETTSEMGANLIITDHPSKNLLHLKNRLQKKYSNNVIALNCDLESENDRNLFINKVNDISSSLNCLINNAAFVGDSQLGGWSVPFNKQDLTSWRRAFEVNLTAPFHFSQGFNLSLKKSKNASIINILSIYSKSGPDWSLYDGTNLGNPAAYAASKGGLAQLTRWLSTTLAPKIRVNAISPGGIYRKQEEKFVTKYSDKTPLKRMAKESDFKGAIAYLVSDLSEYVTGETLNVDGGWSAW